MSLSEEYEIIEQQHKKIQDEHDSLLVRTISVTNDVLREQLRDEYITASEKLAISDVKLNFLETQIRNELFSEMVVDFKEFYIRQFEITDLINVVNKINKIDMATLAEKNRLRLPTSLKQQRELAIFANALNYKFVILDYEGFVADEIGKGTNLLYIYSLCFTRFIEPISHIVGIPKASIPKAQF